MLPSSTASGPRRVPPPASQLLAKADCEPKRFVREFRGGAGDLEVGAQGRRRRASKASSAVDVVGTSKGRGFSGVMKRHNFQRPAGHARCEEVPPCTGRHRRQRVPQPRVQGQEDARPVRQRPCTMRNQKLVRIDAEKNLLLIRGAVPGPNGGYVVVQANEQDVIERCSLGGSRRPGSYSR